MGLTNSQKEVIQEFYLNRIPIFLEKEVIFI